MQVPSPVAQRRARHVGVHHHLDELGEADFGLPAELGAGLRRVADEQIDLGRAEELVVDDDVVLVVRARRCANATSHELAHRVRLAGGDDVVVGLVLLQHQPHRPHVVAGEAPVALRVEVAEAQLLVEPELDARDRRG